MTGRHDADHRASSDAAPAAAGGAGRAPLPGAPVARSARLASIATFVVFFGSGLLFATWAGRLPTIRDELSFSPAQMGLLLLVGSLASILVLPISGVVIQRLGVAPVIRVTALVGAVGMMITAALVEAGLAVAVAVTFFLYIAGWSLWDVAMNVHGARAEQAAGRAYMPLFHAGFSLGTIVGALTGWAAEHLHLGLLPHVSVVATAVAVAMWVSLRWFLPEAPHAPGPDDRAAAGAGSSGATGAAAPRRLRVLDAWREPRTLLIGIMVLAFSLTEGAANDWLALGVVDGFDADNATGTLGFALFVTFMTAMRLLAMRLLDRFGRVTILRLCAALATVGLAVFAFAPTLPLALVGVALWGVGSALGFPVGMSAASDEPEHAAVRVSVVSTIGYVAFLVGPPVLGLLAEWVGYRHALSLLLLPLLVALAVVPFARPIGGGTTVES